MNSTYILNISLYLIFLYFSETRVVITENTTFYCPTCSYAVEDDDPDARGCDGCDGHWWHLKCLPEPHQAICQMLDERWDYPLCLLPMQCVACFGEERVASLSKRWVVCRLCHRQWHNTTECIPEQVAIWAQLLQKDWTCPACNEAQSS